MLMNQKEKHNSRSKKDPLTVITIDEKIVEEIFNTSCQSLPVRTALMSERKQIKNWSELGYRKIKNVKFNRLCTSE